MAMASGKWPKKSMVDLYIEREDESWYFKALAILTASLLLLGYIVFAQSFSTTLPSSTTSTLTIIAAVLLALGYSLSVALWFICKSWLFQLEVLFIPCLLSCILGTLNAGITIGVSSLPWSANCIATLAVGLSSSMIYFGAGYLVYRKIDRIRNPAKYVQQRTESNENLTLLPEAELQRQNLARLLGNKQEERSFQQTYRINIPDKAVALKTPPPLTAHFQGLGLTGTMRGPATPYDGQHTNQIGGIDALLSTNHSSYQSEHDLEQPMSSPRATLEAARAKARLAQVRINPPSPRDDEDTLPWPPVITNTRNVYGQDTTDIPLSERHPLERQGHISRPASKKEEDLYNTSQSYRSSQDYDGNTYGNQTEETNHEADEEPHFEIVEGDIKVDLSEYARRQRTTLKAPMASYYPTQQDTKQGRSSL